MENKWSNTSRKMFGSPHRNDRIHRQDSHETRDPKRGYLAGSKLSNSGRSFASYGSNTNITLLTVYSAHPASFVGAPQAFGCHLGSRRKRNLPPVAISSLQPRCAISQSIPDMWHHLNLNPDRLLFKKDQCPVPCVLFSCSTSP